MNKRFEPNRHRIVNSIFFYSAIFFIAFFDMIAIRHYQTDTYRAIMNNGVYGGDRSQLALGRVGSYLVYNIAIFLKIDYYKHFYFLILFIVVGVVVLCAVVEEKIQRLAENRYNTLYIRLGVCLFFAMYILSNGWIFGSVHFNGDLL